tara:strand:- start:497 stop:1147 length:651 start_codon:yes stop_codon:yes gene_type:complete
MKLNNFFSRQNKPALWSVFILPTTFFLSSMSFAEVTSLSSSELTETYIKDSTIIVTPKKQADTQQKTYSSLTIAPIENSDHDISELQNSQNHLSSTETSVLLNDETLRNASVDSVFDPELIVSIPSYQELITPPIAEILDDPRYAVPEGDFDYTYVGGTNSNNLGIGRSGDQFTFSIGNLPQIDQINLPHGINEGPLQITPRAGGGFDLTINIPER